MMDTGLSNMDMEFSKYLISLNKQYYPSFLNYILIYEMPWVLNGELNGSVLFVRTIQGNRVDEYLNFFALQQTRSCSWKSIYFMGVL